SSAISDKQNKLRLRESRLKDLPNMTLSLERLLMQIGVANINQLRELGAVQTFSRLKQYNKHLSVNVLYILAAAINGHHVAILSRDEKNKLKEQVAKITHDTN
ncbi:MAG: TfoX/Sxy family protein, partial [Candidatus Schmidhempelia sp.]|nr:TfoX/Sxy family protein [Candidatus Schmidhempelia sp.]